MPKFIVPDDSILFQKFTTADFANLNAFSSGKKSNLDFSTDERFTIHYLLSLTGDGGIVPDHVAELKLSNFAALHGSVVRFKIPKTVLDAFFDLCMHDLNLSSRHDFAFRLYLGKNSHGEFGAIMVPIITVKTSAATREHETDLERTLFALTGVDFFAIATNESTEGYISWDWEECLEFVRYSDTSDVKLVFFTLDTLDRFTQGTHTPHDPDYIDFTISLAREGTTPVDKLTVIVSCMDASHVLRESAMSSVIVGATARGIYFDEGDLIPPPPLKDSFFFP